VTKVILATICGYGTVLAMFQEKLRVGVGGLGLGYTSIWDCTFRASGMYTDPTRGLRVRRYLICTESWLGGDR